MNTLFRLRSFLLNDKPFRIGLSGIAFAEGLVGVPLLCYAVLHGSVVVGVVGAVLTVDSLSSLFVLEKLSNR